jgi:mono/diheme cytochrome c family protein
LAGCGGGSTSNTSTPASSGGSTSADGLTDAQLKNGIGPITSVTLGAIDATLAKTGEELFALKCSMCHKVEERYIGPALNDVLQRRTPEYVMNMILNPVEMTQKHPEARKLLAEFSAPMADQSLTQEETRAILEYLRTIDEDFDEDEEDES